jgi:hypothetical protein
MAPVVYQTEGKQFLSTWDASAAYVIAADGAGTSIFTLRRGGPSGNGLQVNSFDEIVMNNTGGLGVSTLRASTSNPLCYNTTALTGYHALATCSSLSKYKANIAPLGPAMDLVLRLNPVSYTSLTSNRREIGLVAEEVAGVEPRLATYDSSGALVGVDYGHVAAIAVQALKDVNERLSSIERRLKR